MSQALTRRERREQRRQQRPQRQRGPAPRRPLSGNGLWIGLGVVAAIVVLFLAARQLGVFEAGVAPIDLRDPKYATTSEVVGQQLADEGNAHLPAGQKGTYRTTPPTSGAHWGAPAGPVGWGVKDTTLPDEATTHNLEHGGIVIAYKALTQEETEQLKGLVRVLLQNGFPKIILEPYPAMNDARIAVSAWRWQLKLATYDDVQIVRFVRQHYDGPDAPERGVR